MRGKRAKKYKKLMHQYELQYSFREPYQVLLDSQILQDYGGRIDIVDRLKKTLGGEVKPMISQCCVRHLYNARPKLDTLIAQAKSFERRRCNHHELENPLTSLECLSECVDPKGTLQNKHRYVVASNDNTVRAFMRRIPGVPLVYIHKSVMILEPPSVVMVEQREQREQAKFKAGIKGRRGANAGLKRKRDAEEADTQGKSVESIAGQSTEDARPQKKKRSRGPKEPNPLSVKKSKKQPPPNTQDSEAATSKFTESEDRYGMPPPEDREPEKRKRKRKHKPKGNGEAVAHEGGDTGVS